MCCTQQALIRSFITLSQARDTINSPSRGTQLRKSLGDEMSLEVGDDDPRAGLSLERAL